MSEDNFRQLLSAKECIRPGADFDNELMARITKHAASKSAEKKYLKLMYLFFIVGLILGFSIALSFVDMEFFIGDYQFSINKYLLSIPVVIVILFLFEKIYKATLVRNGKERFSSV